MASSPAPQGKPKEHWRTSKDRIRDLGIVALILICIYFLPVVMPLPHGTYKLPQNACVQTERVLVLAMFQYANDNDGKYPDGKSSTEVFQKLLDGGYVTDPALFYVPMKGKKKGAAGQKLKPENVSWDVTGGVDAFSSDQIPIVFLTGYKVSYVPGGGAVPLSKPFPRFGLENPDPNFTERLFGWTIHYSDSGGIAVAYKNKSCMFKKLEIAPDGTGSIPRFIPPDFKPDGNTYRQLTPDGPLP